MSIRLKAGFRRLAASTMRSFTDNRRHYSTGPDPVDAPPELAQDLDFLRYDARWRVSLGSARLRFGPELERSFEVTTQRTRAREMRLTISLSVGFYLVTIATDQVLVLDIGWLGMFLRLAVMPPWALFTISAHRFSAVREGYAVSQATFAVLLLGRSI